MEDWRAIEQAMVSYAEALDARDWALLDRVFADDVEAITGGPEPVRGRIAFVAMIRGFLEPCGPTQHLLGPTRAAFEGGAAESVTPFRAFHCDRLFASRTYEAIGRYHIRWRLTPGGWRAARWEYRVAAHVGDSSLLGAAIP